MKGFKTVLSLALVITLSVTAYAHPGRLDSNDGHNKNSDGTYHYHIGDDRTIEYSSKANTSSRQPKESAQPKTSDQQTKQSVKITVNGKHLVFAQNPVNIDGSVLVPYKVVFEALGAEVKWDGTAKNVTAVKDNVTVIMQADSTSYSKNGEKLKLNTPVRIIDGVAFVPVKEAAVSFGASVEWKQSSNTVAITYVTKTVDKQTTSGSQTKSSKPVQQTPPVATSKIVGRNVVYWTESGDKIHLEYDCPTFRTSPFYGILAQGNAAKSGGWCQVCSKDMTDEIFLRR